MGRARHVRAAVILSYRLLAALVLTSRTLILYLSQLFLTRQTIFNNDSLFQDAA